MKPIPEDGSERVLIEVYDQQFSWSARYAGEDSKLGQASVNYIEGVNALGVDTEDPNSKDDKIVKGEFHISISF